MKQLTQKRLKELLHYDPSTGVFTWLVSRRCVCAGGVAGGISDNGYTSIGVDGSSYYAHRLAWLYTYGYLPEQDLDHINRSKVDNKITNLRHISRMCNNRNTGLTKSNKTGIKGVYLQRSCGKYVAQITVNYKNINLGIFKTMLEAACHRLAAEQAEEWVDCDNSSTAYVYVQEHINLCIK